MRSQFLDTSKAFDRKWHEGLLYKLKTIRISGDLPSVLQTFLKNRFQRVVLNGQSSDWSPLKVEVPQVLFWEDVIYPNDLPKGLELLAKLFADDFSLSSTAHELFLSASQLDNDFRKVSYWT